MRNSLFSRRAGAITVAAFAAVTVVGGMAFAGAAHAQAADVQALQNQVNSLIEQVRTLQGRIKNAQSGSVAAQPTGAVYYNFGANLRAGDTGKAVSELHGALEREGFVIADNEKNASRYGETTVSAVAGFQEKYRDEILAPVGLSYGNGFAGKSTRAKLNSLRGRNPEEEVADDAPVVVVFPNRGETLKKGTTYTMKWTVGSNVREEILVFYPSLRLGGETGPQVASQFPDEAISRLDPSFTSFKWTVPESLADGNYTFCVTYEKRGWTSGGIPAVTECSDAPFQIVPATYVPPPSIQVIYPNGGEVFQKGKTYVINWEKTNNVYLVHVGLYKKLLTGELGQVGIPSLLFEGGGGPVVGTSYNWLIRDSGYLDMRKEIPLPDGDNYKICIIDSAIPASRVQVQDCSDGYFTITSSVPAPITIKTSSSLSGTVGKSFEAVFETFGGFPGYTFSVTKGKLPPGLSLLPTLQPTPCAGTKTCPSFEITSISVRGTPTAAGSYKFTLTAKDKAGATGSATFVVTIGTGGATQPDLTVSDIYNDGGKLSVKIANVGTVAVPKERIKYLFLYIRIDDQLKWTYSASTFSDLSFLSPGGATVIQPQILSGTHTINTTLYEIDASTIDANNRLEKTVDFSATTPITIKTSSSLSGTVGKSFEAVFEAFGGTPGYEFTVTAGSLPPGLSLMPIVPPTTCGGTTTSAGSQCAPYGATSTQLRGAPTVAGNYKFTLVAKDRAGETASKSFDINISPATTAGSTTTTPFIVSIIPDSGPTSTLVALNGTNLGSAGVYFNSQLIPQSRQASSAISFYVPNVPVGSYPVFARNSASDSNTVFFGVTPAPILNPTSTIQLPFIQGIYPSSASAGALVEIFGGNFTSASGYYNVICFPMPTVNGGCYNVNVASTVSTSHIQFTLPSHIPAGTYQVYVTNGQNNARSDAVTFTVVTAPPTALVVTAPSAGTVLEKGKTYRISWVSLNVGAVILRLTKGGTTVIRIAGDLPSSGSYDWKVPTVLPVGSDYVIRALDAEHPAQVYGDSGMLSISAPLSSVSSGNLSASVYAALYEQARELELKLQQILMMLGR